MRNLLLFALIGSISLGLMAHSTKAASIPQKVYTCSLNAPEGEPERLQYDLRLETYNGRVQIVEQGVQEALKAVSDHPDFVFLNTLITSGPDQDSRTRPRFQSRAVGGNSSESWIATASIQVQYFQVQLGTYPAAVKISGSSRSTSSVSEYSNAIDTEPASRNQYNFRVLIRVFPNIFDTRSYWIASEERWASTAEEAVADAVFRSLHRFEQYLREHLDRSSNLLASNSTGGGANISQCSITKSWDSSNIDLRQVSVTGLLSQFGFSFSSGSKP